MSRSGHSTVKIEGVRSGYVIKEYFANHFLHMPDMTIDLRTNALEVHQNSSEPWTVTLVDTGEETLTGRRIKRVAPCLDDCTFLVTDGDGVGDIDTAHAPWKVWR